MLKFFIKLISVLAWLGPAALSSWAGIDPVYMPLQSYLLDKGLSAQNVAFILNHNDMQFPAKMLAGMFSRSETTRDYEQFKAKPVVERAQKFFVSHASLLQAIEHSSNVSAKIIVAILCIESNLGNYTGNHSSINTLASQAVLDTPLAVKALRIHWPQAQRGYLDTDKAKHRFARRAQWARDELWALLQLVSEWQVSPFFIKGSPAGAIGMPQFMPTSIQKWAVDGNSDGSINLNSVPDAAASVANYLRAHGWRSYMNKDQQIEVLLFYNKSRPYAEAVLTLSQAIK